MSMTARACLDRTSRVASAWYVPIALTVLMVALIGCASTTGPARESTPVAAPTSVTAPTSGGASAPPEKLAVVYNNRSIGMLPLWLTLDAGITTIRDAGGAPAGLKLAVERGIVPGPRMQMAVSIISQTGGHGDGFYPCCIDLELFGIRFYDVPRGVADGIEEVRKVTREILRAGADWIKLATSGGVLSTADSPRSSQLTVDEIAAAVYEAGAQDKRCMAHAQGTQGIKNALLAGVASIEHGVYLTGELVDMMLERQVYLVPTLVAPIAVVEFSRTHPDILPPMMAEKATDVIDMHRQSFRMAVEAGVKIAMGTDSGVGRHGENGRELGLMVENGMTPMQAIVASTSSAAQLLHLSSSLGTLEEGKLADVIVVDGDVLDDINRLANPRNVRVVLKGGAVMKNRLAS